MRLRAEFTVEPFLPGKPGPHVRAAIDAAGAEGLTVEVGPFGSSIDGREAAVLAAVARLHAAAFAAGAQRVVVEMLRVDGGAA